MFKDSISKVEMLIQYEQKVYTYSVLIVYYVCLLGVHCVWLAYVTLYVSTARVYYLWLLRVATMCV